MTQIILASTSPRRIEMFQTCGFSPQVCPSSVEETVPFPLTPVETVMYLALKKAMAAGDGLSTVSDYSENSIIVGADTIVASKDGKLLGKPENRKDAFQTLLALRNTYHFVMTGVAMLGKHSSLCFYETTQVFFSHFSEKDLCSYIQTDEPYDKAGGYAIQGTFGKYVSRIRGDKNNVIGFPMTRFQHELHSFIPRSPCNRTSD